MCRISRFRRLRASASTRCFQRSVVHSGVSARLRARLPAGRRLAGADSAMAVRRRRVRWLRAASDMTTPFILPHCDARSPWAHRGLCAHGTVVFTDAAARSRLATEGGPARRASRSGWGEHRDAGRRVVVARSVGLPPQRDRAGDERAARERDHDPNIAPQRTGRCCLPGQVVHSVNGIGHRQRV